MSETERLAVEEMIRSGPDLAALPPPELRVAYDEIGGVTPPANNIVFETVFANGVAAEFGRSPSASGNKTILYFHGGGYLIGSLKSHRGLISRLGSAAGVRTLAVDYRLAPEHPYPAASDDAITAYRWLLEQGVAPSNIAFAGDSAGGGLSVATMLRARDEGVPLPAAAVLFSPWADLTCSGDTLREKAAEDVLVSAEIVAGMSSTYLAGADPRSVYASPIFADLSGLPPLLIHAGTAEVLLDDTLRLLRKAAIAGVSVDLKIWPKLPHVWQIFANVLEEGQQSLEAAGKFLSQHLA